MTLELPLMLLAYPFFAILCYLTCFKGTPIFDDMEVLENASALSWRWKFIRGMYRPVTTVSYALQKFWPNTFRSIHAGNALIHAFNGMIVSQIASQLGMDEWTAFVSGLLFTVHPFASNTVAFMSGRASILSSSFGFLAVLSVLSEFWPLALPFLGLAFLSKEDGIGFFPLVLGVSLVQGDWAVAGFLVSAGAGVLVWKWPMFWELLDNNGDRPMREVGLPPSLPQPQHGYTILVETLLRLPLWFLGFGLSPYHGSGVKVSPVYRAVIAILLSFIYSLLFWLFPIPTLLLLLGPWTVYLLCRVPDQICEYRSYSSLAGMVLLASFYIKDGWTLVSLACVVATASHAWAWSSPTRMWQKAALKFSGDPSRANGELGAHYKIEGKYFEAELALRHAIRLNPNFGPALNNLSWILWENSLERPERKEALQQESIALMQSCTLRCPLYALGWQDLGKLYDAQDKRTAADACYRRALELEPRMVYAVNRLGVSAFLDKDFQQARARFDDANRLQPDHFEFVYNRAVLLKHTGELEEAQRLAASLPRPMPLTRSMIPLEFCQ
jgi:tetratricopeptide (TPR) repeat protein